MQVLNSIHVAIPFQSFECLIQASREHRVVTLLIDKKKTSIIY